MYQNQPNVLPKTLKGRPKPNPANAIKIVFRKYYYMYDDSKLFKWFLFLVLHEFCRISVEFILKGVNQKLYNSAASKWNSGLFLSSALCRWAGRRVKVHSLSHNCFTNLYFVETYVINETSLKKFSYISVAIALFKFITKNYVYRQSSKSRFRPLCDKKYRILGTRLEFCVY